MVKSIAELRATPVEERVDRVTRPFTLYLAPARLKTELDALMVEHDEAALLAAEEKARAEAGDGPKQRAGGTATKVKKIRARLAELHAEMSEYLGTMTLRANLDDGQWRRWVNEHPARGEDDPGYERDQRIAAGYCDADALIDNLGAFVHQWEGEPCTAADWAELFEAAALTSEKAGMATKVVEMYESRPDFSRLLSNLSSSLERLNGSN